LRRAFDAVLGALCDDLRAGHGRAGGVGDMTVQVAGDRLRERQARREKEQEPNSNAVHETSLGAGSCRP
jgi:hypothetical protein